MKVDEGKYSVAELVEWMRAKSLVANAEYQRGSGIWPTAAKSYFIDTILRGYPFPKVYFYEGLEKGTRLPRREIVDGQQRLTTILEFIDGKFSLGQNAMDFQGKSFTDLDNDTQDAFFGYTVAVDVIRNADRSEILQMFRRMNAYTLPLNPAEKRHSQFFGKFKDWVNTVLDRHSSFFLDWRILTSRQVVRMADAELIVELVLAMEEGIVSSSPSLLSGVYKKYDSLFEPREIYDSRIEEILRIITVELSDLQGTYLTKAYVFHSLFCALYHNRFGLKNGEELTGLAPIGSYFSSRADAISGLRMLASAHEEKDASVFGEYVKAASEGGNRVTQRALRVKWLAMALRGDLIML